MKIKTPADLAAFEKEWREFLIKAYRCKDAGSKKIIKNVEGRIRDWKRFFRKKAAAVVKA